MEMRARLLAGSTIAVTSGVCRSPNQLFRQSCHSSRQESSIPPLPETAAVHHPRHEPARHRFTRVLETSQAVSFYFLKKGKKKNQTKKNPIKKINPKTH